MKITSTVSLGLFFMFFCFLIFIHIPSATSQIAGMKFHQLTGNDGLSQNYISCMLQEHRGYMWIGTKDGLNRYDGYSFTVYRNDPFNTASFQSSYITTYIKYFYRSCRQALDRYKLQPCAFFTSKRPLCSLLVSPFKTKRAACRYLSGHL